MKDTINWGIIGCGTVCEKKSGPAFYKISHSRLLAVMRRDEAKAKDFAERHNVSKFYTDADKLINDPEIDIIYIATPPDTHKTYAIKAMKAGKPVYVEKPMALNFEECEQMCAASEETKQKLFVAFYRRALPYFLKVKDLLDSGAIGKVLTVKVEYFEPPKKTDYDQNSHTWRVKKEVAGEGYFLDLAPHTLDILDFLLGDIAEAKGYSCNLGNLYKVKDTISATMRFSSGVLGTGLWSFVASETDRRDIIEITGTDGRICFSTFKLSPIQLITDNQTKEFEFERPEHIQQHLIQTIVDELRGVGVCPSTKINGARTSKIMDMILKP